MLHVPQAVSMSECITACCKLPGCDLAWVFEGRCYIVNCQRKDECKPMKTSTVESYLTFVQKSLSQRLGSQAAHYKERGHSLGLSPEDESSLADLALYEDRNFGDRITEGDYLGDYKGSSADGDSAGPGNNQKNIHGPQDWQGWDTTYNLNPSSVKAGENEDLYSAEIQTGALSESSLPVNGSQHEDWSSDETKQQATGFPKLLPVEKPGEENLEHNVTSTIVNEDSVSPLNSSLVASVVTLAASIL
ncbi:dyslexia-associated protein KIAA0319 homolog [Callorhinchus milii]|uniref:dyslexia-associated protein KIAA0319 homolog n=1 Tax=Callorhinchus milii TaxID=7868 RepID=UPI00045720AD|nr:dyslexia-associated protein KIAA0319 homolog [Callorhinchus milii]|eukprot:gi/632969960/ref/XP_007901375.1/ PREDICTED: dyslexia-associated protein KIAA0319 homolog [Callorhinchus milii]